MATEPGALRIRARAYRCSALVAVIAFVGTGCGLRTAQRGTPAATAEGEQFQPAPDWVVTRLAQAAPDVHFALGKQAPGARERSALADVAPALKEILREFPDLVIVLEGHCDDRGSTEYNRQLGSRRAAAVQEILVTHGFPAHSLRTVSLGDTQPQCLTRDEACRQKNRRVHFRAVQKAREPARP